MASISESPQEEPLFRTAKRRRVLRKRPDEDDDLPTLQESHNTTQGQPFPALLISRESPSALAQQDGDAEPPEEIKLSAVEILRRRKAAKSRRGGIEFSNLQPSMPTTPAPPDALVPVTNAPSAIETAASRFAPQTGKVKDELDKHMMAYIDAEMAKRRDTPTFPLPSHSHSSSRLSSTQPLSLQQQHEAARKVAADELLQKQPASLGKLQEIDLGPDAMLRNIARTQAATRRLEGYEDGDEVEGQGGKRIRLGRDGKPWRGRKRRNSDDVKRDKLVEEVLRESKLDKYDEPDTSPAMNEEAADERLAEEFKREFENAQAARNIRRAPAPPGGPAKGGKNEAPKGPKLGGSRSARAAMRALEEKAAKKR